MSASSVTCVACQKPLQLVVQTDEDEENEHGEGAGDLVDDDVHLRCGCHFHWECLLEAYSVTECPNCGAQLSSLSATGEQELLCNLKNEGGLQESLDILPLLLEEAYLKAYPEERRSQAFLEFCAEGDLEAIVDVLRETEEDDENPGTVHQDILRYQDNIKTMRSGLHMAVLNQQKEVAWLLLYLASSLDEKEIPTDVLQAAANAGISRPNQSGKEDIRALHDNDGLTAEEVAEKLGGWEDWLRSGWLRPPN